MYQLTVHAEDLTQMYSYSVQEKSTLLGLVLFMKNSALLEDHVTAVHLYTTVDALGNCIDHE